MPYKYSLKKKNIKLNFENKAKNLINKIFE